MFMLLCVSGHVCVDFFQHVGGGGMRKSNLVNGQDGIHEIHLGLEQRDVRTNKERYNF